MEIAQYLLERGAEMDARDLQHESTPAQHMLRVLQGRRYRRDRQDIARYLVSRGCRTDILMAAALGDLALAHRLLEADPACIRTCVSEEYFPKRDPRGGGSIYNWIFGPRRTAHLIARDFGHDDVFGLLVERSPEDLKLARACGLGDEDVFQTRMSRRPDLTEGQSEDDWRRLTDAHDNKHNE